MRRFKIGLLLCNLLAAKHYLLELDDDGEGESVPSGSDYSIGQDTELLNRKLRKMCFFSV